MHPVPEQMQQPLAVLQAPAQLAAAQEMAVKAPQAPALLPPAAWGQLVAVLALGPGHEQQSAPAQGGAAQRLQHLPGDRAHCWAQAAQQLAQQEPGWELQAALLLSARQLGCASPPVRVPAAAPASSAPVPCLQITNEELEPLHAE